LAPTLLFDEFYDPFLSPLHISYKNVQETSQHYRLAPLFKTERNIRNEKKSRGADGGDVQTCSGHNRIIPLMRRPNTHSTSNKPV